MTVTSPAPMRLQMIGIEKRFGGVQALKGADLSAYPGEILGLCGENGAGKSTILKVLSGVYPAGTYKGQVLVEGQPQSLSGTAAARKAGIAIVHQELMLVPRMTVAENLLLGREPSRFGLVDDAAIEAEARRLLGRFGFGEDIQVTTPIERLGIGLQQIVEIVRALSLDARILVLDEPTAALTGRESDRLMALCRELRARGTTCIYVSHRMDEIFTLCDRITVMRDGRTEGTVVTKEVEPRKVIAMMVGRELTARGPSPPPAQQPGRAPALEVVDLSVGLPGVSLKHAKQEAPAARAGQGPDAITDPIKRWAVDGVSLSVRAGEIVALCGAMGAGRTAVLSTLFGCAEGEVTGRVSVDGAALDLRSPQSAIKAGLALLPEDRKARGLILGMTVSENLSLPSLADEKVMGPSARAGLIDEIPETLLAAKRIDDLRIRGAAASVVATLSGGNQQKVVLGKWLAGAPRVLLLDEPTRGVDVGAREEIYSIIEALCAKGVAVLMASSDLPEVLRLAHRIIVLRHGRIAGELDGKTATQQAIVHLSTGASHLTPGGHGEELPT